MLDTKFKKCFGIYYFSALWNYYDQLKFEYSRENVMLGLNIVTVVQILVILYILDQMLNYLLAISSQQCS